jgi:CAAX amino terminal protease family protein
LTFIVQNLSGFSVEKFVFPSLMVLLGTFVMFFIAATVEELGYAAYATEALQKKYNSLITALIIGVPWALWHLNSMIQVGQTPLLIIW